MTTVTAREFRATQKHYFDLAAKGERVVVRRRLDSFVITPVVEDDYYTPTMLIQIEQAIQQAKQGKCTKPMDEKQLSLFLDSL